LHRLLALQIIKLLQGLLGKINLALLIRLYFLEYLLIFVLSVIKEGSYHLLEQVKVKNLITFAASIAHCIIKELFKCQLLILIIFGSEKMALSHVSLSNICGLIVCHKIEAEHQAVVFISAYITCIVVG